MDYSTAERFATCVHKPTVAFIYPDGYENRSVPQHRGSDIAQMLGHTFVPCSKTAYIKADVMVHVKFICAAALCREDAVHVHDVVDNQPDWNIPHPTRNCTNVSTAVRWAASIYNSDIAAKVLCDS